jgi:hypothetical protein
MSRTTFKDRSGRPAWRASLLGGLLALVLLPALASAQSVEDKYQRNRDRSSLFNLAASPVAVLRVNQYQCGLQAQGATCTDVFDSPTGGGGFWPTGSPNQYMFNSGIQVVGIIPMADDCTTANKSTQSRPDCFAWSGDTVGAFFMDASGLRQHGTPLTDIYDSLNPDDLANWPGSDANPIVHPDFPFASAMVTDTSLFNPVLIGRRAASQQDSWVMYWDGDGSRTGGRTHPLGVVVEQRTMAWNYPSGNESIVYIIYKFTNVTDNRLFQQMNETRYSLQLPDAGWRIDSMYVAFLSDPDVTLRYSLNYATAILPFNLGLSYDGQFFAPEFDYPPALFHAPFFTNAPGIVGIKYLKSPIDPLTGEEVGLTSFSLTTNGGAFPDPSTVQRGWRYISLNVDPSKGDPNCTFTSQAEIRARRSCYLAQVTADVRFFVGSGPFSLEPGESATIAVAQYAAATVATDRISRGTGTAPQNQPGFPSLAPGCFGQPIRAIDIASGYPASVPPNLCPEDVSGEIDAGELARARLLVPNSLLGRAMVAQSIFDNKFLLGFAPETPPFYLVPGDNRITVIWEPSATETQGDPFFSAAGDPTNPLFDPNYRQFDVEGYRIYRGTSPADLQLVAQFDKAGSVFVDRLCMTDAEHVSDDECTVVTEVPIVGEFVQYTTVARLATGTAVVLDADTALVDQIRAGRALPLRDTGVPFAYVDTEVRNGFQYFYQVTAFDINSVRSGPTSLESAGPTRSTIPVRAAPNLAMASFSWYLQGETAVLNPDAAVPAIHAQDGTFSGPMPPTNDLVGAFAPLVERLLPKVRLEVRIDSVKPFYNAANCPQGMAAQLNSCWRMYLTVNKDGQISQVEQLGFSNVWRAFGGPGLTQYVLAAVRVDADPAASAQFNIPTGTAGFNATAVGTFRETIAMSQHVGQAANRAGSGSGEVPIPSNLVAGGSRWFAGANETEPDPTRLNRVGHIPGVDSIFTPFSPGGGLAAGMTNNACWGYQMAHMARAADVEFRWGAAGVEVWDVTHDVPVLFKPSTQASYGFLVTDANGNGFIDYDDFISIEGVHAATVTCARAAGAQVVQLQPTPSIVPVSVGTGSRASLTQTGMGFGLYVNGERYIVQLVPGSGTATLPTSGTWTHRSYAGWVSASVGQATEDPSGYVFNSQPRPPMVPGLRVVFEVEQATALTEPTDLKRVHTVPDPYYATSAFDLGPTQKELQFVNLPPAATIRIYSLSGVLVDVINHSDPAGGGMAKWNLRNRSNQFVASGVYLFHVSTPDGKSEVGKFTVVNSGFAR